jgi:uncharacterized membrane protein
MPYCTKCGTQVNDAAAFCQACGGAQPGTGRPASGEEWLQGMSPRTAAMLCYVPFVGWVGALIFLATQKFRGDGYVRFHAFQGLYMAMFWLLIDIALLPVFGWSGWAVRKAISGSVRLAVLVGWVYMLVRTSNGETVRLPVIGELAEKSAAEQGA